MTEPQDTAAQSGDTQDGSHASVGRDVASPGGGRTEAETTVDEAMGQEMSPDE